MEWLAPSEIRFIQDSIACRFQDGGSVNDIAKDICHGVFNAEDFPAIQVIRKDGKCYSFDNRRLYVFRVAEYEGVLSKIRVKIVSSSRLNLGRFTTENDGREVEVRGAATLKHCKSHWLRPTPIYTSALRPPLQDVSLNRISIARQNDSYGRYKTQANTNLFKDVNFTSSKSPLIDISSTDTQHGSRENSAQYGRNSDEVRISMEDDELFMKNNKPSSSWCSCTIL